jgi:two-component system sensor histidine kinase DctS
MLQTNRGKVPPVFSNEDLEDVLQKVYAQANRAGNVIRSVHEFVRKREPQRAQCTVEQLLESIRPLIDLQTRNTPVRVEYVLAEQLPPLWIDRVMLEQVLLNLTRNAIEAMSDNVDEGVLVIRAFLQNGPEQTADDSSEAQARVTIAVEDNGHGIPPEIAAKLFSPFFTTKHEGMGIGLNICRSIIEYHHGRLWFDANQPKGCRFSFSLPPMQEQR